MPALFAFAFDQSKFVHERVVYRSLFKAAWLIFCSGSLAMGLPFPIPKLQACVGLAHIVVQHGQVVLFKQFLSRVEMAGRMGWKALFAFSAHDCKSFRKACHVSFFLLLQRHT